MHANQLIKNELPVWYSFGSHDDNIISDGYTQDEILLSWYNESNVDSVQINEDLELPQFDLEKHTWGLCNDSYIIGKFNQEFLCLLFYY